MIPRATYRLQFHKDFTFADAAQQAPYFAKLGVSHIYASPILTARAGSMHGYDVVDHTHINPELGGADGFEAMARTLAQHGLGIIVDIVPNHMAVGGADNRLWLDMLAKGRDSIFARFFDIDFETPDPALRNKVLAPFLGDPYGIVLKSGDLKVVYDEALGTTAVAYHHHRFPLRPEDQDTVRADLSAFSRPEALHALLERQNFRLAWWRTAGDQINWRRFFDIIELAGLRIEDDLVFDAVHEVTFDLYARGLIDGVRVDHVDGLADPATYCSKLRARLTALESQRPPGTSPGPAYIVVEKILSAGEVLPPDWPINGTTGYDFMNTVSALQHDPAGEAPLATLWHQLSGRPLAFEPEELRARAEILTASFEGQLDCVARLLAERAAQALETRDLTPACLRRALIQLIQHLRVYRTYATGRDGSPPIGDAIEHAFAAARRASYAEPAALDFIAETLAAHDTADLVRRFNQLTAPVTAKSVEDTAFYRAGRLLSRNDVGFDPRDFSLPTADFHADMEARALRSPSAMLATATHDHKRGEDVRARLAVLSEIPERWKDEVQRWSAMNASIQPQAVRPGDEYQLYQTILGCWPIGLRPDDRDGLRSLQARIWRWFEKALREAKTRTSWTQPDADFEKANADFVSAVLDPDRAGPFLDALAAFAETIAAPGVANGLVQAALRCTMPGVPDLYQGTEYWDFSLVDPDNRQPVDYDARRSALATSALPSNCAETWQTGHVKQAQIAALLALRNEKAALFQEGSYRGLSTEGMRARNLIAFERRHEDDIVIVIAALHTVDGTKHGHPVPDKDWWADTSVALSAGCALQDCLSGLTVPADAALAVGSILTAMPVAVLTRV